MILTMEMETFINIPLIWTKKQDYGVLIGKKKRISLCVMNVLD